MKRRSYIKSLGAGVAAARFGPRIWTHDSPVPSRIRLGGPIFDPYDDPGSWVEALKRSGYSAAYCPVGTDADPQLIREYETAAGKNDIIIAEVGAWCNTISPDQSEAEAAIEKCTAGLQLADRIGARCCVNISGSKNPDYWAGPHKDNLTDAVFDQVVETTRRIIDAVNPLRSFFALEAMPWSYPYSTGTYLRLLKAIDRKSFGVHLDPVNMITSPKDYFNNGALIREMFSVLGPYIRSCHAKDITLRQDNYIPQMDETRAGLGTLDYKVYLHELSGLDEVPLMLEHLQTAAEYELAASYIRSVAGTLDLQI